MNSSKVILQGQNTSGTGEREASCSSPVIWHCFLRWYSCTIS